MLATSKQRRSWLFDLLLIAITLGTFYLLWLGNHPLFTPDEGRYSEVAREMIVSGDYITPRLNGVAFLDKPILYYWLQASAIKAFGLKEWALRFWPASLALWGCLATYLAGRLLFNRRTGIISAIILATNPLYYGAAHYANLDLEVAVLISTTLLFALLALQSTANKRRTTLIIMAYIFCSLAALTKGLIGLVFPMLIIGSWILMLNRWYLLAHMRLLTGISIFILLTVPWYFLVQKANPQFLHFFFVTQQYERFLTKADFNNPTVAWFYVPVVLAGFLPWSIFLIQAVLRPLKLIIQNKKQHSTELFLLLWAGIVFIFFSFPKSKTVGYILPLFPALALIVGNYVSALWNKPKSRSVLIAILSFILLCVAIVSGCLLAPHIKTLEVADGLVPYLNATAAIFVVGAIIACYLTYKNNMAKLFMLLTFISTLFLFTLLASANAFNQKSIKPLVLELKSIIRPNDEVITFYRYYQDLPIYLERRVTIVADWHASDIVHNDNWVRELWYGIPFQNTSAWLIEEPVFWQRWNSHHRVFVLMKTQDFDSFAKKTTAYKLAEYNDVTLASNKFI